MKTIVLTGGGTAGHVMPALALVDDLKCYFDKVYYLGENGGIEQDLAAKYGVEFFGTSAVKFKRDRFLVNLKIPFVLAGAIKEAKQILKKLNPSVVFAKGGYVSLPTCFAAKELKIPIIIHESDMTLGLANRIVKPFAKKVLTSYESTQGGIFVGNPIRKEILTGHPLKFDFPESKPVMLVMGGSGGSKTINDFILDNIDKLNDYNIIHIFGKSPTNINKGNYFSTSFVDNIQDYYATADIVVSRGGANSLNELTALGKRTLVIPLPKGVSRGDQIQNAMYFENKGLVNVLLESQLNIDNFLLSINELLHKPIGKKVYELPNNLIIKEILSI